MRGGECQRHGPSEAVADEYRTIDAELIEPEREVGRERLEGVGGRGHAARPVPTQVERDAAVFGGEWPGQCRGG